MAVDNTGALFERPVQCFLSMLSNAFAQNWHFVMNMSHCGVCFRDYFAAALPKFVHELRA
ncbi:hypothetical protein BA700_03470 [Corynebacterium stationis]|nr:hypothetical protein AW169_03470 [Corynebacterium stationis]AQX70532.1 hypothetical protein CA21670_02630 [Corynebacterium stationis]ASJ18224.1 hypothetical protein BA700_03470 [Corynebacterium stationis]